MKHITGIWFTNFSKLTLLEKVIGIITFPVCCIYYLTHRDEYLLRGKPQVNLEEKKVKKDTHIVYQLRH